MLPSLLSVPSILQSRIGSFNFRVRTQFSVMKHLLINFVVAPLSTIAIISLCRLFPLSRTGMWKCWDPWSNSYTIAEDNMLYLLHDIPGPTRVARSADRIKNPPPSSPDSARAPRASTSSVLLSPPARSYPISLKRRLYSPRMK